MEIVAPIPRCFSLRVASFLLLLCVLAQLSVLDHVFVAPAAEAGAEAEVHTHDGHKHGAAEESAGDTTDRHNLHCHGGLATCSDLPLAAGPGQILFGSDLLLPALLGNLALAGLGDSDAPLEASVRLLPPPPQPVL